MSLDAVAWDACVLEPQPVDPAMARYVRRELGTLPSSIAYFAPVPWVVRSMTAMSGLSAPRGHVPIQLVEVASLVVSQDNSCRYCYGIQRLMLRVFGVSEQHIQKLEQGLLDAEIDPYAKSGLDFARRLSRAAPIVSGADAAALRNTGWTNPAIAELAFQAAYDVFMNRLMTAAAIPYAPVERLGDMFGLRWIAPILRFSMQRKIRRGLARAVPLTPEQAAGPFAYVVRALGQVPAARALRETLDAAFASPVLSRRAKALIFAVIARGLDCPQANAEAARLAADAGISGAQLESILQHLGSPDLDPFEAALLPFARGTIRGRPQQIQQRTRPLRDALSPAQVVEAIGLAALANTVGRLGVVTQLG